MSMSTSMNSNELVEVTNNIKGEQTLDYSSIDKIRKTQDPSYKHQIEHYFTAYMVREYGPTMIRNLSQYYDRKLDHDSIIAKITKKNLKLQQINRVIRKTIGEGELTSEQSKMKNKAKTLGRSIARLQKMLKSLKEEFIETPESLIYKKKGEVIISIERKIKNEIYHKIDDMRSELSSSEKELFLEKYDFLFEYSDVENPSDFFESKIETYENALKKIHFVENQKKKMEESFTSRLNALKTKCDSIKNMLKVEKDKKERALLFDSYGYVMKEKYDLIKQKHIESVKEI